jgi:hypothetical protein
MRYTIFFHCLALSLPASLEGTRLIQPYSLKHWTIRQFLFYKFFRSNIVGDIAKAFKKFSNHSWAIISVAVFILGCHQTRSAARISSSIYTAISFAYINQNNDTLQGVRCISCSNCSGDQKDNSLIQNFLPKSLRGSLLWTSIQTR